MSESSESCQRSRHLLPACSSVRGGLAVEGIAPSRVHITTWLSVVRADFVGKWALIHFLAGIVWPSQHLQNTTRRSPARVTMFIFVAHVVQKNTEQANKTIGNTANQFNVAATNVLEYSITPHIDIVPYHNIM